MSLSALKRVLAGLVFTAASLLVAAPPASAQSTFEAQLLARIQALEVQLAQLNGQVQDLQYRNQQLSDQLTRALNDVDFRLGELEGGSGHGSGASAPAPAPSTAPAPAPVLTGPAPTPLIPPKRGDIAPTTSDPMTQSGMGLAGIESVGGLTPPSSVPVTGGTFEVTTGSTVVMPAGDPAAQYNWAYGYVRQGDYDGTISAMSQFIQANPTDGLAGNAQYWLGDAYWARGETVAAAQAFRTAYQWDPTGSKAPDSLLRLGQAYAAIGQPADACTAFLRLANDFPTAAPTILQQLQTERARTGC